MGLRRKIETRFKYELKKFMQKVGKLAPETERLYYSFFGGKVECNICHYKTKQLIGDQ
jgi:hypothetical protein